MIHIVGCAMLFSISPPLSRLFILSEPAIPPSKVIISAREVHLRPITTHQSRPSNRAKSGGLRHCLPAALTLPTPPPPTPQLATPILPSQSPVPPPPPLSPLASPCRAEIAADEPGEIFCILVTGTCERKFVFIRGNTSLSLQTQ